MAQDRLQLQTLLENLLVTDEQPDAKLKVYFQPPANVQMEYPCVVYQRSYLDTKFAGNAPYRLTKQYLVTVIDRDPDSVIPDKVAALPLCSFDRAFVADSLNHDVFRLFF
jgi:hypothetical protein